MTAAMATGTILNAGNGAFLHSCYTHSAAAYDGPYTHFEVRGVTMQQAVSKWWDSDVTTQATENIYTPCLYSPEHKPHSCNPSCSAADNIEFFPF